MTAEELLRELTELVTSDPATANMEVFVEYYDTDLDRPALQITSFASVRKVPRVHEPDVLEPIVVIS